MPNLSEFMPQRLDIVKDVPITVLSFEKFAGQRGPYILISAKDANGLALVLRTSGTSIIRALEVAQEAGKLPIEATFSKDGNVWVAK